MLFKVIIQKIVVGKHKPTERDFAVARRVIVVEADSREDAAVLVRRDEDMLGQDTTGEIVAVEGPLRFAVLSA